MKLNVGRGGVPSLFFISMFFSILFIYLCCIGGITIIDQIYMCVHFSILMKTYRNYIIRIEEKKAFDVMSVYRFNIIR